MSVAEDRHDDSPDISLVPIDGRTPGRPSPRIRLLTAEDVRALPNPKYLVDGVIVERSFAALYGLPGSYKSFAALDLAYSVATGIDWAGRAVHQCPSIYIAGEGRGGLRGRLRAWELAHGVEVSELYVVDQPVNFLDTSDVDALIAAIQTLPEPPGLIVVDTLARCFGGGDENATRDMNAFVAGVDRLRFATNGTLIPVHHAPHKGGKLRGSSVLPGAADTIISVHRDGRRVTLRCEKQKEAAEFEDIHLVASVVTLEDETSSLVLVPDSDTPARESADITGAGSLAHNNRDEILLQQLAAFGSTGARAGDWQHACELAGIPRASFYRRLDKLESRGRIAWAEEAGAGRYWVAVSGLPDPNLAPATCAADANEDVTPATLIAPAS